MKQAQEYAPGIMDKHVYGDPTKQLAAGQLTDYVLQHHQTLRRPETPHLDLRIGTPTTGMYSWAIPKATLPEGKEKRRAVQTQIHSPSYNVFQGNIGSGYGAGTVTRKDLGKALLTKVSPNSLTFTVAHSKIPTRYALVYIGGKKGRDWLLIHKADPKAPPGVGDKPNYKLIEAPDMDDAMEQALQVQEKIDGAHVIHEVRPGGAMEAYSVRPRKTGEPIVHTERLGLNEVKATSNLSGTVMRGETYAIGATGRPSSFQQLSGILNSTIARALETQRAKKLQMRNALFDIIRHKGVDVSGLPILERQALLKEVVKELPQDKYHMPLSAEESEQKAQLLNDIRTGKNPRTSEGVIMHMPGNKIWKYKLRPESKGYITGTFPGKGGRTGLPGGVTFSETPGGEEQGHLGSGFTVDELKDIAKNLETYKTKPMRITHMGKFPAGTLRAPVFSGWETDVKEAMIKKAVIKHEGKKWTLYTSDASRVLGTHDSEEEAQTQERAIQYSKVHQKKADTTFSTILKPNLGDPNKNEADPTVQTKRPADAPERPPTDKDDPMKKQTNPAKIPLGKFAGISNNMVPLMSAPNEKSPSQPNWGDPVSSTVSPGVDQKKISVEGPGLPAPTNVAATPGPATTGGSNTLPLSQISRLATMQRAGLPVKPPASPIINNTPMPRPSASNAGAEIDAKVAGIKDRVTFQVVSKEGRVKAVILSEIADTPERRRQGLSKRAELPEGTGMFFDQVGAYWMKDVNFPLDIVFLDKQGTVLEKQHMPMTHEPDPCKPLYVSQSKEAAHALELPAGWFERQGLASGDRVQVIANQVAAYWVLDRLVTV